MELGFDAVLINTAIARARDPVGMAEAFSAAVEAGSDGIAQCGPMEPRERARALDAGNRESVPHVTLQLDRFYPIVENAAWVERLVGLGARLIQLRMKDS